MPTTAVVSGPAGKLWQQKPAVRDADGTIVAFERGSAHGDAHEAFSCCTFTSKATSLVAGDADGATYACHLKENRYVKLGESAAACSCAAAHPLRNDEVAVGHANGHIILYGVKSGKHVELLRSHRTSVLHICFSGSGGRMVSASRDIVVVWHAEKYCKLREVGTQQGFSCIGRAPGEDQLYMVTKDASVSMLTYEGDTLATLAPPLHIPASTCSAACSPDGHLLVVAPSAPIFLVWDLPERHLIYAIQLTSAQAVLQLLFQPDSKTLAVLTADSVLAFVDVVRAQELYTLHLHAPCRWVALDTRANYLAALALDGNLTLYDLSHLRRSRAPEQPGKLARLLPRDLKSSHVAPLIAEPELDDAGLQNDSRAANRARPGQSRARSQASKAPGGGPGARPGLHVAKLQGSMPQTFNMDKLRKLLTAYGEYPEKYRQHIWEFLLRLPHNRDAFALIADKGAHPCTSAIAQRYPLRDAQLLQHLMATLSQLAHWCPLFAEVGFLPTVVFPFVKMFRSRDERALEACITFILNWGHHWFELFPHPPLNHLNSFERLLQHHDPQLYAGLSHWDGGCAAIVWDLLSSLMTDVLNRREWLKVWDHVLTNEPIFWSYVVLSYLLLNRRAILAATSLADCPVLTTGPTSLDVNKLIRRAYLTLESTPGDLRPPSAAFEPLAPDAPSYPEFRAFPARALEVQRSERQRIADEEAAVRDRQQMLDELLTRGKQLQAQTDAIGRDRDRLLALANERRGALKVLEQQLLEERVRIDSRAKTERLKQIGLIEDQYRAHLQMLREEMQAEVDKLQDELEHKQALRVSELRSRAEEERILAMEFEARQRMWAIEQASIRQASAHKLRSEAEAKEAALEAKQRQVLAELSAKDEQMTLKAQHEAARYARLTALAEEARAQADVDAEQIKRELEQSIQLQNAQLQQRLRHLAEAEARATQEALTAEQARTEGKAKQAADEVRLQLAEDKAWIEAEQARREEEVAAELQHLVQEKQARAVLYQDVERTAKQREVELHLLEARRLLERQNIVEEQQTTSVLSRLQSERQRDRAAKLELLMKEEELARRMEDARQGAVPKIGGERLAATAAVHPEDAHAARQELLNEAAAAEGDLRRRQEDVLSQLATARNAHIAQLEQHLEGPPGTAGQQGNVAELEALQRDLQVQLNRVRQIHMDRAQAVLTQAQQQRPQATQSSSSRARVPPAGAGEETTTSTAPTSSAHTLESSASLHERLERDLRDQGLTPRRGASAAAARESDASATSTGAPEGVSTSENSGGSGKDDGPRRPQSLRDAGACRGAPGGEQARQSLKQELRSVRAIIEDLSALRRVVVAGTTPQDAKDLRQRFSEDVQSTPSSLSSPPMPGVLPGFMTPGRREKRGGQAFFVEIDKPLPSPSLSSRRHRTRSAFTPFRPPPRPRSLHGPSPLRTPSSVASSRSQPLRPLRTARVTPSASAARDRRGQDVTPWSQRTPRGASPKQRQQQQKQRSSQLPAATAVAAALSPQLEHTLHDLKSELTALDLRPRRAAAQPRGAAEATTSDSGHTDRTADPSMTLEDLESMMSGLRARLASATAELDRTEHDADASAPGTDRGRQTESGMAPVPEHRPLRLNAGEGLVPPLLQQRWFPGRGQRGLRQHNTSGSYGTSDVTTIDPSAASASVATTVAHSGPENLEEQLGDGAAADDDAAASASFGSAADPGATSSQSTLQAPTLRPSSSVHGAGESHRSYSAERNPLSTPKKKQRCSAEDVTPPGVFGRRGLSGDPLSHGVQFTEISPGASDMSQSLDLSLGLGSDILGGKWPPQSAALGTLPDDEGSVTLDESDQD